MDNLSSSLDLVFGALADPTRRAVLERLGEGEASIGELAQPFDMALPSLMKHVRVLEAVGLVESQKNGRVRTCRLKPAGPNQLGRCFGSVQAENTTSRRAFITRERTISRSSAHCESAALVDEVMIKSFDGMGM